MTAYCLLGVFVSLPHGKPPSQRIPASAGERTAVRRCRCHGESVNLSSITGSIEGTVHDTGQVSPGSLGESTSAQPRHGVCAPVTLLFRIGLVIDPRCRNRAVVHTGLCSKATLSSVVSTQTQTFQVNCRS